MGSEVISRGHSQHSKSECPLEMTSDPIFALLDELAVRELQAALAELEAGGIEPIVFKGAALAHTHYPESWLRPRLDADLLIPPEQRWRASEILVGLGYRPPPMISGELISYQ